MSPATLSRPLIEAPASDALLIYETLGYIEAHDAMMNGSYAFVVFRETDRLTGRYIVRIASRGTAGASFDPASMCIRCREAAAKNETYFIWGYSFTPSPGDPRRIEFRVHQTAGLPTALEIFIITRNADSSPQPARSLRIENFIAAGPTVTRIPLIRAPVSDGIHDYKALGYVEAHDAVSDCDYAFVAYQETEKGAAYWRVCIKSTQTAGGSFDPAAIRAKARETGERGRAYFTWGYHREPVSGDPRQIEFRIYVTNGAPREVEIFVRLRKADHRADLAKSVRFPWPCEP
jgi:hypothetical protein